MAMNDATTAVEAPRLGRAGRPALAALAWRAALPSLVLALVAMALTGAYYRGAYQTTVLADDRIRGLFVGFQSIEGESEPYRWTKGDGTICLPAIGLTRPLALLELRLLGSSVTAGAPGGPIDKAGLRVGALRVPLAIAPESRAYRLLLPPAGEGGPVCVTLSSATVDPSGTDRPVGVGLRSAELRGLRGALPPPGQLLVNLWLCVGGYWLLRRLGLPAALGWPAVLAVTLVIGAGVIGGALRVAPDLPFWSMFAAIGLGGLVAALGAYQWAAPRLGEAARELLGVTLALALLVPGWTVLANLDGYFWPFPLMARAGTSFGWGVLPAVILFVLFAILALRWLRDPEPPAPWLVIAVIGFAAIALPATLKVGLRGYESLFQTFAVQEGNYIEDLPLVGNDPLGFLRGYVPMMPELALHNKTHPPGGVLFLWAVDRLVAPGPEAAAWVVMGVAALGVWPTYRLAEALLGRRAATLAAAIYAVLPAFMIYAATSMDALFATVMAWAIYALYRALVIHDPATSPLTPLSSEERGAAQLLWAAAAGAWLALGLFFSFTTLMLALVVLGLTARRIAIGPRGRADLLRWAVVGGVIAGATLLPLAGLWVATGYNSVAAFFSGIANNRVDVTARVSPIGLASYLFFLAVNSVAYGWFLGPWIVLRLGRSGQRQVARSAAGRAYPADALGVGMAALLLGMLLSGLFYREIERIWLFSHILIAAVLADGIMEQDTQRRQLALAALILGTLFAHSVIFRATLRVSW